MDQKSIWQLVILDRCPNEKIISGLSENDLYQYSWLWSRSWYFQSFNYWNVLWQIECLIKITSGNDLILEICVSDFTLVIAELLASMALYPINEFAAKETCRGAEIESDAVVYRAIVDPE